MEAAAVVAGVEEDGLLRRIVARGRSQREVESDVVTRECSGGA
jgi:hypothetical protein